MKAILNYMFFLLFSISSFGQSPVISQYEKADIEYKGNHYSEILGVNKNETVIIKIDTNRFIVFSENNGIYRYQTADNKILTKHKILNKEAIKCFQYLDSLKSINPSNLNITEKKVIGQDVAESIKVEDGSFYNIELFKKDITIQYISYSPEIYIEHKFPFYRERLKLLNDYKYYISLFKQNDRGVHYQEKQIPN